MMHDVQRFQAAAIAAATYIQSRLQFELF